MAEQLVKQTLRLRLVRVGDALQQGVLLFQRIAGRSLRIFQLELGDVVADLSLNGVGALRLQHFVSDSDVVQKADRHEPAGRKGIDPFRAEGGETFQHSGRAGERVPVQPGVFLQIDVDVIIPFHHQKRADRYLGEADAFPHDGGNRSR